MMETLSFYLTNEGSLTLDRLALELNVDRETVLRRAFDLFSAAVQEIRNGKVIGSIQPITDTFHDWNLGSYQPRPSKLLTEYVVGQKPND